MKRRHVLLLLEVHAGHRLVEQQQLRLHRQRAAEFDALLQAVGQACRPASCGCAWISRKSMISSTRRRARSPRPAPGRGAAAARTSRGCIFSVRPAMMLSSVVMPLNSATFWKVRAMPPARRLVGRMRGARLALEGDAALLRLIEAVDDVEHRGLAGAVRADDGADLALADVEGDVASSPARRRTTARRSRPTAAPRRPQLRAAGRAHAAFSSARRPARSACRDLHARRRCSPLRPSSKVTSVEMSASVGAVVERLRPAARSARR